MRFHFYISAIAILFSRWYIHYLMIMIYGRRHMSSRCMPIPTSLLREETLKKVFVEIDTFD